MKNIFYMMSFAVALGAVLVGCTPEKNTQVNESQIEATENQTTENQILEVQPIEQTNKENDSSKAETTKIAITKEMAYKGVNNYCHSNFEWSQAEENPELMAVTMGEETDTEYQVVFRSYTGSMVYFFVDKMTGDTRMVDYIPALELEEEAGMINIYDYLDTKALDV